MMNAKDIRELSEKELQAKEGELIQELFNLKFQFHSRQLEQVSKISVVKKDLARIKTILKEKRGVTQA